MALLGFLLAVSALAGFGAGVRHEAGKVAPPIAALTGEPSEGSGPASCSEALVRCEEATTDLGASLKHSRAELLRAKLQGFLGDRMDFADLPSHHQPDTLNSRVPEVAAVVRGLDQDRDAEFVGMDCASAPCVLAYAVRLNEPDGVMPAEEVQQFLGLALELQLALGVEGSLQTWRAEMQDGRTLVVQWANPAKKSRSEEAKPVSRAGRDRAGQLGTAEEPEDLLSWGYSSEFVEALELVGFFD